MLDGSWTLGKFDGGEWYGVQDGCGSVHFRGEGSGLRALQYMGALGGDEQEAMVFPHWEVEDWVCRRRQIGDVMWMAESRGADGERMEVMFLGDESKKRANAYVEMMNELRHVQLKKEGSGRVAMMN